MQPIRHEEKIHIGKPVEDVFAAWTTADAMSDWFAPMAMRKPDVDLDFREGGHYSIRMELPENQVFRTSGVYREIVTNRKIVMTWRCDAFPDPETLVTVVFQPDGSGTTVKVVHENFAFEETSVNHQHGWQLCFQSLRSLLET